MEILQEQGNTSETIENTSETSNYFSNTVILHEQGNVLRTRKSLGT